MANLGELALKDLGLHRANAFALSFFIMFQALYWIPKRIPTHYGKYFTLTALAMIWVAIVFGPIYDYVENRSAWYYGTIVMVILLAIPLWAFYSWNKTR